MILIIRKALVAIFKIHSVVIVYVLKISIILKPILSKKGLSRLSKGMQKKEALSLLMHLLVALGKLKSKGLLHI